MIVIGAGRVGTALGARAQERGEPFEAIDRQSGWEALEAGRGPILVTVRNDDLEGVVERVPQRRRQDLVFVQNGMIRPWLRDVGLMNTTRGLLWFAVTERGGPIVGGWGAQFCGEHAGACAAWFAALDLPAEALDWMRFSTREGEKLLWLSAMGVLCELYGMTVGQIAEERRPELAMLVRELLPLVVRGMGLDYPLDWIVGRIVEYSETIPDYRASVKEWRWRNGWLDQVALRGGRPTPLHHEFLRAIGKGDLIALRD